MEEWETFAASKVKQAYLNADVNWTAPQITAERITERVKCMTITPMLSLLRVKVLIKMEISLFLSLVCYLRRQTGKVREPLIIDDQDLLSQQHYVDDRWACMHVLAERLAGIPVLSASHTSALSK
jgi:hypothetical protein